MMSDVKAGDLSVEVVTATGEAGDENGCTFRYPYALCQLDGALFVADYIARALYRVDGVLCTVSGSEASLTAALLTAIPVLPKELARVMAQYAHSSGVRTIAGSDARPPATLFRFDGPTGIAVDTTDAAAGPALIVADHSSGLISRLNPVTGTVTVMAGGGPVGSCDGPALQAATLSPYGVAVAPNGVVFAVCSGGSRVCRISAPLPKRAADGSAGERVVTTVVGARSDSGNTIFPASAAECFRRPLENPLALCLLPTSGSAAADGTGAADEKDAVSLFVGCADGVHPFDLARGERKHFALNPTPWLVTGLALDESGTRLFALRDCGALFRIDLQSGAVVALIPEEGSVPVYRAKTAHFFIGAVFDADSRSLIVCDAQGRRLLRIGGVCN